MSNIQQSIQWAISQPVVFGQGGGVLALPPIPDNLLVWLKGLNTTDDTAKLDSWAKPDRENMVLSQSAAIAFDGVAEKGVSSSNLGTIVSYEGTATMSYDGTNLTATAGTCWRIEFSNGAIFPIAEVNGLTSWDTTGTHTLTFSPGGGGIAGMRAARQDSGFNYNANFGWYEISGDDVKYPHPVVGYTTHHKAGTMNYPESLMAFEEKPVGSPDGISDEILLPFNVPVDGSITYDGTTTATLDIINNKITMTAGTIRNIVVSGTLIAATDGLNPDGSNMLNPDGSTAVNP